MDRPADHSPFHTTNPMVSAFGLSHLPRHHGSSASRNRLSNPTPPFSRLQLAPASTSARLPQDIVSPYHSFPNYLLGTGDSLLGDTLHDLLGQTTALSRDCLNTDFIPLTGVRHESKVPPHLPWNPIDAISTPMKTQSDIGLIELKQNSKRPQTDSGYESSKKYSLDIERQQYYDDPIGSIAQQRYLLPDQQQFLSTHVLTIPGSPAARSVTVIESQITSSSGSQSFRCEECMEGFHTKSEMSKHMARHNKKFTCDHPGCPRGQEGFATKNDLDRHKGSVHRDHTVSRKVYKCSVPGCKDPNKVWDRKDNFKAHVKRMHPDVDAEAIVVSSYQGETTALPGGSSSLHGNYPGFGTSTFVQSPLNSQYSRAPLTVSQYSTTYSYGGTQEVEDANVYDVPVSSSSHQPPPHQIPSNGPYPVTTFGPSPAFYSSATVGPSVRASSATMAELSNMSEQPKHFFQTEPEVLHFPYLNNPTTNQSRPIDVQTAPIIRHVNDDFPTPFTEWPRIPDGSSMIDNGFPAIDPSLSTLQSGSWDHAAQPNVYPPHAEISEPAVQHSSSPGVDTSVATPREVHEREVALREKIKGLLDDLPTEQLQRMVNTVRDHAQSPSRASSAPQPVPELIVSGPKGENRPFKCSRKGCLKTFTQNNIKTKHEKRHDRLFFCTFDGCYSKFGSKDDLRRHEKRKHEPDAIEGWRCFAEDVVSSAHRPECFKFFDNEEKFKQHRRDEHRERADRNDKRLRALQHCHMYQGSPGHFWCGFCNKVIANDLHSSDGTKPDKFRYDHIDQHITKEKKSIDQWVDLKSEGLTKTQVKARKFRAEDIEQDDSGEEDYNEGPFPVISTTVVNSETIAAATSSLHPSIEARPRKRARSVNDSRISDIVAKRQRPVPDAVLGQTIPSWSRNVFNSMINRMTMTNPDSMQGPSTRGTAIQCCQCNTVQMFDGTLSCGNQGCFHTQCPNCSFRNSVGNFFPSTGRSPDLVSGPGT